MLSRERYELQVGFVFLLALVLLVIGVLWAKRIKPGQQEMAIEVLFPSVGGLNPGDDVLVSGVRLGAVKDIALQPNGTVLVAATLGSRIALYQNYRITITMLNFTGEMGMTISPGAGRPLPTPLPVLHGERPLELTEFVAPAMEAVRSIRGVSDTLRTVIPRVYEQANATLSQLDAVLLAVDENVARSGPALAQALAEVRTTMGSAREAMASVSARLDTSSAKADALFASAQATSDRLRQVVAQLDTAHGTLGQLIREPTLHTEMTRAAGHLDTAAVALDSLLRDVRTNPKRYVHFSLF